MLVQHQIVGTGLADHRLALRTSLADLLASLDAADMDNAHGTVHGIRKPDGTGDGFRLAVGGGGSCSGILAHSVR